MMNLSEHPLVLDYQKRFNDIRLKQDQDFLGVTVILPGMPHLMGELRVQSHSGLFNLTTNVRLGEGGEAGRVEFAFSPDKPLAVIYPSSQVLPEPSVIVKPH